MNLFWSPWQSEASRQISTHLNESEKKHLTKLSLALGVWISLSVNSVMFAIIFGAGYPYIGLVIPGAIVAIIGYRYLLKRINQFQLQTQYAQSHGITMEQLLHQPRTKRPF
ncbi:hypothetical protein [Pleionea sp. CnH1-48]|uniref:hypothetical protein n=1 Tax=Pleionea sp. CnH1-48 TaxID=2954494 RepID=UPI002098195E|nr:hypothetical protein [Pleionea sp. CnH1-48]MCO7225831.1 hypothetical protein [Pleionea sp. CnH1-48]